MSDTPRTDEFIGEHSEWSPAPRKNWPAFACQLERELNAANNKIELLMSANADVARIAGERDAAERRIKRLEAVTNDPHALWTNWLRGDVKLPVGIGDVREYQDRIKQLEEALTWYETRVSDCNRQGPEGDAARNALAKDLGRKAKEAKL